MLRKSVSELLLTVVIPLIFVLQYRLCKKETKRREYSSYLMEWMQHQHARESYEYQLIKEFTRFHSSAEYDYLSTDIDVESHVRDDPEFQRLLQIELGAFALCEIYRPDTLDTISDLSYDYEPELRKLLS